MAKTTTAAQLDAETIIAGDRRSLAKGITLLESELSRDRKSADELLRALPAGKESTLRIAVSGPPGVGKSSFIEVFGLIAVQRGKRVAVLAIDPSSPVTGGSIMGDRTRMPLLSASEGAFIRPSPTKGLLGGVAKRTREAILLCEAAGYDLVIIETVGVGQSEIVAESMVDLFITLQLPNSGDELQGIKKGILELSDLVIITKSDGAFYDAAQRSKQQLESALHLLSSSRQTQTEVLLSSSLERTGFAEIMAKMEEMIGERRQSGAFQQRRYQQTTAWFEEEMQETIMSELLHDRRLQDQLQARRKLLQENPTLTGVLAREAGKWLVHTSLGRGKS